MMFDRLMQHGIGVGGGGLPNMMDWGAYETVHKVDGEGFTTVAGSWRTFLDIQNEEGFLTFLQTMTHDLASGSGTFDIRVTVDGLASVFNRGEKGSRFANTITHPVYFRESLKIEVYNHQTSAREIICDYVYLKMIGKPDPLKNTLMEAGSRMMDSNSIIGGGVVTNVSGAGYLLGVFTEGTYGQSNISDVGLRITIDGVRILPSPENSWRIVNYTNTSYKQSYFHFPIRFNESLEVRNRIGFGTAQGRVFYTLD